MTNPLRFPSVMPCSQLRPIGFIVLCESIRNGRICRRQVQRLRERKELVGFNVGRRRLYFQTEIYDYLSRLERENLKHPEQSMEQ